MVELKFQKWREQSQFCPISDKKTGESLWCCAIFSNLVIGSPDQVQITFFKTCWTCPGLAFPCICMYCVVFLYFQCKILPIFPFTRLVQFGGRGRQHFLGTLDRDGTGAVAGPEPFCHWVTGVSLKVYVCIVVIVIWQYFSNPALLFKWSAVRCQEQLVFGLM